MKRKKIFFFDQTLVNESVALVSFQKTLQYFALFNMKWFRTNKETIKNKEKWSISSEQNRSLLW